MRTDDANDPTIRLGGHANTNYVNVIETRADRPTDGQTTASFRFFNNGASAVAEIRIARGSSDTAGDMIFITQNNERLRIDEAGLVGLGTNDPQTELHIVDGPGTIPSFNAADTMAIFQNTTSQYIT